MSDYQATDSHSLALEALTEIRELRSALEQSLQARTEPIAIVGMACRVPGADDPAQFWELLRDGRDATSEMTGDRWNLADFYDPDPKISGKTPVHRWAALEEIDTFDAAFFGVSAREAARMDPQQRLFLEVAWEALENAGRAPDKLSGTQTGVFLGVTGDDYTQTMLQNCAPSSLDAYWMTGITSTFAAGRLAYWLGLHGPSLTLDTACSSALVSVHLAVQSLRAGDCSTALAGGVNLMISPEWFVAMSKGNMLAPDGRCKTFDKSADGYGRGEGCGVVVLKRLSDALGANDRVLAVIRGSAVNQDGRSSGITVPNGKAQETLIHDALRNAGVSGTQVDYVEAHGTGTPLGDPIEVRALNNVLGAGRNPGRPLTLGSAKTNIGHLEAAAGIAGLIKTVLQMQHRQFPPLLHLQQVNPAIGLDRMPVTLPTSLTDWPRWGSTRIAGVSSFGASGTNAHLIVEEAPDVVPVPASEAQTRQVLSLSAKSGEALAALAARYRDQVGSMSPRGLADLCFTANRGRAKFGHRAAVTVGDSQQARDALGALVNGRPQQNLVTGVVKPSTRRKVAFLFTGQGSQYAGMGQGLYRSQPSFRADLDTCDDILRGTMDGSLLAVLFPGKVGQSPINTTCWTQPALFSLEYALARLWRRWGVEPVAMLGHSVGEYVAGCVAGVLNLEDGLGLMAERGRLMQALPEGGGMCAVIGSHEQVEQALIPFQGELSIAAVNGPANVVVSGPLGALGSLSDALANQGIVAKPLTVSHAFHSVLLEPMLSEFEKWAGKISFAAPVIPVVSNLTGRFAEDETFSARYLRDHARERVRFMDGVRELVSFGCTDVVEIGPAPVLSRLAEQIVEDHGNQDHDIRFLHSLRRGADDDEVMLRSLGELHVRGIDVDWDEFHRDHGGRVVDAPTYPFEHQRYWFEATAKPPKAPKAGPVEPAAPPQSESDAGLLGRRVESPLDAVQFRSALSVRQHPCLNECMCDGNAVVNGGFCIETALEAAGATRGFARIRIENLLMPQALVLPEDGNVVTQLVIEPVAGGATSFRYYSQKRAPADAWALHGTGTFCVEPGPRPDVDLAEIERIQRRCTVSMSATEHYRAMWGRRLYFGPSARWIDRMLRGEGEVLAWMRPAEPAEIGQYMVHPGLTDSALQLLIACLPEDPPPDAVLLLSGLERFSFYASGEEPLLCHAVIREGGDTATSLTGDLRLLSMNGTCVAQLTGVVMAKTTREAVLRNSSMTQPTQSDQSDQSGQPVLRIASSDGAQVRKAFQLGTDVDGALRLRALLTARISTALGGLSTEIDGDEPLQNLGLDSLLAVEVSDGIGGDLGMVLPAAIFMDNPTLDGLEIKLRPLLQNSGADLATAGHQVDERTGPGGMHVVEVGSGPPVVFVHGGAVSGMDAWQTQMSLADRWHLIIPSRLGYGKSAISECEDFAEDALLIAELLGDGAHLVGQSYGTVGALLAAAARPAAVLSLTLIESGASDVARGEPVVDQFVSDLETLLSDPPADDDALFRAIFAIIDPKTRFPARLKPELMTYAGRARNQLRWPVDAGIPFEQLHHAKFPKLIVSGGEREVFETISDALADRLGGDRIIIPGGHATQNVGSAFNNALEKFLTRAEDSNLNGRESD